MNRLPSTIGRYEIRDLIGQGGMGVLYLGFDPAIDRPVAIKVLKADSEQLEERFRREARSAGRLLHPHIVTIYEFGVHDGRPFIAMEYISGETLGELIRRRAPLPLKRRLHLIADLCSGLAFAHKAGIVHRDVKPANVMVTREGILKILDFGIARVVDSGMTQAGTMIGTPNYMSPEQVDGRPIDLRSDVFSVGLVLYELIVLRQAFPGDAPHSVVYKILTAEPEPLQTISPGLDPGLVDIVSRAIQKDPNARYSDLLQMRAELLKIAERLSDDEEAQTVVLAEQATQALPRDRRDGESAAVAERRAQVESHLESARRALEEGRYETAIAACEQAASLDPADPRAAEWIAQARAGLEARQIQGWLQLARDELARGALTKASRLVAQTLAVKPRLDEALALQREIQDRRREQELMAERKRAIDHSLAAARELLQQGALESAIRSTNEVLAREAAHEEAAAIKRQALALLTAQRGREEQARREQEARAAHEREEQARREQEARAAREREEQARREQESRAAREREEQARREQEARAAREREEQARRKQEQERRAREDATRRRTASEQQRAENARPQTPLEVLTRPKPDDSPAVDINGRVRQRPADQKRSEASPSSDRESLGRSSKRGALVAAGVLVIVLLTSATAVFFRGRTAPASPTALSESSDTDTAGRTAQSTIETRRDSAAPGDSLTVPVPTTLTVDIRPWARVRILSGDGAAPSTGTYTTPFAVALAPGKYTLQMENGGLTKPLEVEVTLTEGSPVTISRNMPGFDAGLVVDSLLGPKE